MRMSQGKFKIKMNSRELLILFVVMTFYSSAFAGWPDVDEVQLQNSQDAEQKKIETEIKNRKARPDLILSDHGSYQINANSGIQASLNAIQYTQTKIKDNCFKSSMSDVQIKQCHFYIAGALQSIDYFKSFIRLRIQNDMTKEKISADDVDPAILKNKLDKDIAQYTDVNYLNLKTKDTLYGELKASLTKLEVPTNDLISNPAVTQFTSRFIPNQSVTLKSFSNATTEQAIADSNNAYSKSLTQNIPSNSKPSEVAGLQMPSKTIQQLPFVDIITKLAQDNLTKIDQSSTIGLSKNLGSEKIGVPQDSMFRMQSVKFEQLKSRGYFLSP